MSYNSHFIVSYRCPLGPLLPTDLRLSVKFLPCISGAPWGTPHLPLNKSAPWGTVSDVGMQHPPGHIWCPTVFAGLYGLFSLIPSPISLNTTPSSQGPKFLGAKALWWSMQEGEKPRALPLLLCCICCACVCAICNAHTRELYKYFDGTAYLILLAAFSLPKTPLRTVCPSSHPCSPCLFPSPHQNEFSPRRCPAPCANSESVPPVIQTSSTNVSPSWSSSWDLSYIFFEWNICSPFAKVFMVTHEPPSWKVERWYWLSGNWGTGALLLAGSQAVLMICVRPWPWPRCLICPNSQLNPPMLFYLQLAVLQVLSVS